MERLLIKLVLILVSLSIFTALLPDNRQITPIQGESVLDSFAILQGRATSGATGISMVVDADGPSIVIHNPKNETYHNAIVTLRVRVNDSIGVSRAHYNLNNGVNITLPLDNNGVNQSTALATQGSNILTVFANDTLNNWAGANLAFSVNHTIVYIINWSKFEYPGSTNLSELNATQLERVENLTFVIPSVGKIKLNQEVNLTNHNLEFGITDLSGANIVVTSNFIFINSTVFPNLNTTAELTLSSLTFNDPRILRDGVVCPAAICRKISYQNGDLVFNVSHFSSYEAEEGEGSSDSGGGSSSAGGGGGGGGGGSSASSRHILGELNKPIVVSSGLYGRIIFTLSIENKPHDYSITITGMDRAKGWISLRIDAFERIESSLNTGIKQEFDLNTDGKEDIALELLEIGRNTIIVMIAPVQMKGLEQDGQAIEREAKKEEPGQVARNIEEFFAPEKEERNAVYLLVVMTLVVGTIVIGKMMASKKKGRDSPHKKRKNR